MENKNTASDISFILERLAHQIDESKRNLEELMNHPAATDENDYRHNTYIGYINTTRGAIKAQQELYDSLSKSAEPYQEELTDELDEIEKNVGNEEAAYQVAETEIDKMLDDAQKQLDENDVDMIFALRQEIMQSFAEQNETNFFLTKQHMEDEKEIAELKAVIEEIRQQMEANSVYNPDIAKSLYEQSLTQEEQAKSYLAMKPFSYAHYQLSNTVKDIKQSVSDAKDSVILTKTAYKNALQQSYNVAKTKVTNTLSPMVTAAGHTAIKATQNAADLYRNAMEKAMSLFESAKVAVKKGMRSLNKSKNIILDTVTFGGYSMIRRQMEIKKNQNLQENEKIQYWDDIKAANPFWGNKAAASAAKALHGESPVQNLLDKMNDGMYKAGEFFRNTVTIAKEDVAKVKQSVKDAAKEVRETTVKKIDNANKTISAYTLMTQAKAEELKADAVLGIAKLYSMSEKRIQSRIQQLHQADHEIFEANNQMRKVLHNMVEITPYVQKQYECSAEVAELTDRLREIVNRDVKEAALTLAKQSLTNETAIVEQFKDSQNPACQAAYRIANRAIEKEAAKIEYQMTKEQKRAEKSLDKIEMAEFKAESAHNLAEAKKALETDRAKDKQFNDQIDAYNELMDNKDELIRNHQKIAEAKEKLEAVGQRKDTQTEKAQQMIEKASSYRREAEGLLSGREDY